MNLLLIGINIINLLNFKNQIKKHQKMKKIVIFFIFIFYLILKTKKPILDEEFMKSFLNTFGLSFDYSINGPIGNLDFFILSNFIN